MVDDDAKPCLLRCLSVTTYMYTYVAGSEPHESIKHKFPTPHSASYHVFALRLLVAPDDAALLVPAPARTGLAGRAGLAGKADFGCNASSGLPGDCKEPIRVFVCALRLRPEELPHPRAPGRADPGCFPLAPIAARMFAPLPPVSS